jgi:glycosyltransferase involved in cell wall biosynthesis
MDSTADILNRYGPALIVHHQLNRGPSAARNAGIMYMRGELALFLDADDLLPDGYLRRFALAAREAPEVEVFHCGWRGVTFDGSPLFEQEEPLRIDADPFHELPVLGMPHISSLVVRRSLVERIGGFDSDLPLQEDWDYALRLSASGARFRGVPGNVAIIRRRPDSLSAMRRPEMAAFGLAVLERHLRFHPHCSSCTKARVGLQLWQRAVLRADAQRLAKRLGLTGRTAGWIGLLFATVRHPRLVAAGLLEAFERLRRFAGSFNC